MVNKSLNEYDSNTHPGQKHYNGIYFAKNDQPQTTVIMEADEESYYQNDSPERGRKNLVGPENMAGRSGFSHSPPSNKNNGM